MLISVLSIALGGVIVLAVSSDDATAFPSGPNISYGANPLWSAGGSLDYSAGTIDIITAPSDQDVVVTDVVFTFDCSNCWPTVSLTSAGSTIGSFVHYQYNYGSVGISSPMPLTHGFVSGLLVPAGETLSVSVSTNTVNYTLSGYYAAP